MVCSALRVVAVGDGIYKNNTVKERDIGLARSRTRKKECEEVEPA